LPSKKGEYVFKRFHFFEPSAKNRLMEMWVTDRSGGSPAEIRYRNTSTQGEATRDFLDRNEDLEMRKRTRQTNQTDDDLQFLLGDSRSASRDRDFLVRLADAQRRVVHPAKHASLSVDCLTCHTSGATGAFLARELGFFEKRRMAEPRFAAPEKYNLTNSSPAPRSLVRFRAFGYFESDVSLLDRTIHESAFVAEALNRNEAP
jgi:hypothetical protein